MKQEQHVLQRRSDENEDELFYFTIWQQIRIHLIEAAGASATKWPFLNSSTPLIYFVFHAIPMFIFFTFFFAQPLSLILRYLCWRVRFYCFFFFASIIRIKIVNPLAVMDIQNTDECLKPPFDGAFMLRDVNRRFGMSIDASSRQSTFWVADGQPMNASRLRWTLRNSDGRLEAPLNAK